MKNGLIICILIVIESFFFPLSAQKNDTTIVASQEVQIHTRKTLSDTVSQIEPPFVIKEEMLGDFKKNEVPFKPNSTKAVIYSAIFPGLGQIYNRKYWKLPIVYGGFLGVVYGVTWNGRYYDDYSRAYKDLYSGSGTSWKDFIPPSKHGAIEEGNTSDREDWLKRLRRQKDFYRRNRDLAIIAGVGLYALCIIDAYVDAQLYDFDMSEDLSMRIEPVIWTPTAVSKISAGVNFTITF